MHGGDGGGDGGPGAGVARAEVPDEGLPVGSLQLRRSGDEGVVQPPETAERGGAGFGGTCGERRFGEGVYSLLKCVRGVGACQKAFVPCEFLQAVIQTWWR